MNFLPFVFTFLLLLSLISSFLFSSILSSAREHKVLLGHRKAYLQLLSRHNKALYRKHYEPKEGDPPLDKIEKDYTAKDESKGPRSTNDGRETSKVNLMAMIHGNNPQLQHTTQEIAIRLLDLLYGEYDFYKNSSRAIVEQMIGQKIDSFEELRFEDENLNQIYYKILKGTNTGYPSLHEYFRLSNDNLKPIYFSYTSKLVLRAVLGDKTAQAVFDAEKKAWLRSTRKKAMVRKDFEKLIETRRDSLISFNEIDSLFEFRNTKKGVAQVHQEGTEKIRAFHPDEMTPPQTTSL